jgi:biopolymer transport protein ExbD
VEETTMNMTPMIDIVFQLIVFFLLTLRFSTPEFRLEAGMPKDLGPLKTLRFVEDHRLAVSLFRRGTAEDGVTRVKIGGTEALELPEAPDARRAALERVHDALRSMAERAGSTKAKIRTPPPTGGRVPHGDVVAVLDQMVRADLLDIAFEGTAMANLGR